MEGKGCSERECCGLVFLRDEAKLSGQDADHAGQQRATRDDSWIILSVRWNGDAHCHSGAGAQRHGSRAMKDPVACGMSELMNAAAYSQPEDHHQQHL